MDNDNDDDFNMHGFDFPSVSLVSSQKCTIVQASIDVINFNVMQVSQAGSFAWDQDDDQGETVSCDEETRCRESEEH